MSRINALEPSNTQGKTRENLAGVNKMLGATPNLFRVAANAPSVLEGLVAMFGTTGQGTLKASVREALALAVAEANGCDYCLAAHTVLGKGAGLSEEAIDRARDASSADPKTHAILRFAREMVIARGDVSEGAVAQLRAAGVDDAETLEIVHVVVLNIFTNYLNLVAQTDIDFPPVRAPKAGG
jgi:uncharacterized peroxidase-related enzyme